MNIEELRTYCLSFKGVAETIKWDINLVFTVGEKIFLMTPTDRYPSKCTLKVLEDRFEELLENDNFKQAPYMAKRKWVQLQNIEDVKTEELKTLIADSYQMVKSKLTKKQQLEIDSL